MGRLAEETQKTPSAAGKTATPGVWVCHAGGFADLPERGSFVRSGCFVRGCCFEMLEMFVRP